MAIPAKLLNAAFFSIVLLSESSRVIPEYKNLFEIEFFSTRQISNATHVSDPSLGPRLAS